MNNLRRSIRKLILEYVQDNAAVEKLNELIDAANENEATWNLNRWDSDNPYAEPPDEDWNQITELMHAFDYIDNPPRDLKCWYIVEMPDGEIINASRWLSYDEVLMYAEEVGYAPCDQDGNPTKEPAENGCELYFIYEE